MSHSVKNSLWKSLWTFSKTEYERKNQRILVHGGYCRGRNNGDNDQPTHDIIWILNRAVSDTEVSRILY
jgi:hypothetical protein